VKIINYSGSLIGTAYRIAFNAAYAI